MKKIITINSSFASDVMNELPPHAYIDKTVCGVGMTSVALENGLDTLLLVPTKLLVENKANQYPNPRCRYHVLGITGDTDDDTISEYVKTFQHTQPLKVICTYDSFHRVLPFAQRNNVRAIVDESDMMISLSPLKSGGGMDKDVITYMLEELSKMQDRTTFISSTPVPLEYFKGTPGEWLAGLDQYEYQWPSTIVSTPIMCKRGSPVNALKKEVIGRIKSSGSATIGDRTFGKAIVFMNSVSSICKVINDCGIKDMSGIVCGTSYTTNTTLHNAGCETLRVSDYGNLKTFTFVTSTGFQGIDMLDSEAMNIIVTKGSSDVSGCFMVDLQLDVKQAISRNRDKNNPNADRFVFFYSQGTFDKTPHEIEQEIDSTKTEIEFQAGEFSKITIVDDEKYLSSTMKRYTFRNSTGELSINNLVFSYEKYRAIEVINMYHNGFQLMSDISTTFTQPIIVSKPREYGTTTYKTIADKFKKQLSGEKVEWTDDELASENYHLVERCSKELGKVLDTPTYAKAVIGTLDEKRVKNVGAEVKKAIKPGRYLCKDLKEKLQEIYDATGYNVTAKSTDIYNYYPRSKKPASSKEGKYINVQ